MNALVVIVPASWLRGLSMIRGGYNWPVKVRLRRNNLALSARSCLVVTCNLQKRTIT